MTLVTWIAGMIFVGGAAVLAVREQEARDRSDQLLDALEEAHRKLGQYAEQVGELTTTRERNRLAREIHDSGGHFLTVINVQLEAAQALRARDAGRADRSIGEAKRLAGEALAEVRRSVAALRPAALEQLPVDVAIQRQVADFREQGGGNATLTITGDARGCSPATELALYRAVQYGLTNVRKHTGAANVVVQLRIGPATVDLQIRDDGVGIPQARSPVVCPTMGMGLPVCGSA